LASAALTGEGQVQRRFRLTRSDDISRARKSGKSYADPLLVLVAQANGRAQVRVGVVAGKTVGGAVQRNRAKRLLRAAMQSLVSSVAPGWDLILIARPPLVSSDMFHAREVLLTLLRRAELIAPS
jgi:ribonuclease P protein component